MTKKLQMEEESLRMHEQRLVDGQARIKELEGEYVQQGGQGDPSARLSFLGS